MEIPPEAVQIATVIGAGIATKAGLKFIETISPAFGKAYKPIEVLIEATAQVKADEIKAIGKLRTEEKFEQEEFAIAERRAQRALDRKRFTDERKQANLEDIFEQVPEFLPEDVSEEKVDEDWFFQFMDSSQDFSDKQMQLLWAKILAGEIAKPKSYSLRTLNTLRTLSKDEAETFTKVAQAALRDDNNGFILGIDKHSQLLRDEFDIKFSDILTLRELGFLSSTSLSIDLGIATSKQRTVSLNHGDLLILIEAIEPTQNYKLSVEFYSKVGNELFSLVDVKSNIKYIEKIAAEIKPANYRLSYGKILSKENKTVNVEKLFST